MTEFPPEPNNLKVQRDRVVSIRYELFSEKGELYESNSQERDPQALLYGHGGVLPGLEQALLGATAGDQIDITLSPEQAFGARDETQKQRISKKHFANGKSLKAGQVATLQTREGARHVTVIKVGAKMLDVDLNHPHAGENLRVKAQVESVRDATREELAHGHAHGAGGHHH